MKLRTLSSIFAVSCVLSAPTFAEDSRAGTGPNPFSDCGIGAALFPNHPVGAVISNVIWDVGTTAVTSATASPETCEGKNVQAAAFIMDSYDQLIEETAKGSGQHITTLFDILEVEQSARTDALHSVRIELANVVSESEYTSASKVEKANTYYDSILAIIPSV